MKMKNESFSERVSHLLPTKPSMAYLIHQFISTIGYLIGPLEIAQKLKLNPDSVRSCLSKMVSKGLLSKPKYGLYTLSPTHGLGVSRGGVRAQNLVVVAEGVPVRVSDKTKVSFLDLVSVRITFGARAQAIN